MTHISKLLKYEMVKMSLNKISECPSNMEKLSNKAYKHQGPPNIQLHPCDQNLKRKIIINIHTIKLRKYPRRLKFECNPGIRCDIMNVVYTIV